LRAAVVGARATVCRIGTFGAPGRAETSPVRRTLLALAAILSTGEACSQPSAVKITVTLIESDASADVPEISDGRPAEMAMARCCVSQIADAGGGDAAATDSCSILGRNGLGVSEPCLSSNGGGTYGLWTCGADAGASQLQCGDNGLSCSVGDPCTLVDVGCPGIVQPCAFTPYTPPPG
jgi:hypothetical protein